MDIKEMSVEQIEARKAEIKDLLTSDKEIDIEALEKEVADMEARKAEIKANVAERKKDLEQVLAEKGDSMEVNPVKEDRGLGSLAYRKAFKDYVQKGTVSDILQFEKRANEFGVAADLGVLLPETIIQKVMTELEGVYGQLYSVVRKTNIKGGVKYPIGSFGATFKRITETTVSDRQKAGGVTGYVQFTYNIGEIRVAHTLLQEVLSVEAFESEVAKVIVRAYVQAMDHEIMTGDATKNEMEGILTEANKTTGSRVLAKNIIEFTEEELMDWTKWETKLFGEIPMAMEGYSPSFVMAKQTLTKLGTMKDSSGQPIKKAHYDVDHRSHTFDDYHVMRVEKDILPSFDEAAAGDVFAMFWVPNEAYAINTNMEFTMVHYFDQESNQYVDKALVINDGKILNPEFLYLLKKK